MRTLALTLAALVLTSTASSQDLREALESVGADYGSQYVLPLTNSIGADLNAGLFHTAKSGKGILGVNVYVGVKIAGMLVDPAQQRFNLQFPTEVNFDYRYEGTDYNLRLPVEFSVNEAPTIFGEREAAIASAHVMVDTSIVHQGNMVPVSIDTTLTQELIGGILPTRVAPLIIPHASFGSVFGTDVSVRWLPRIEHPNYGSIHLRGAGIRHNVSRYLASLPVDVALSFTWQYLSARSRAAGDFSVDIETVAYGIIVSKTVAVATVYGGIQRERTIVDYHYVFAAPEEIAEDDINVAFSHNASIRGRAVIGVALSLGPLVANADFGIGSEQVASAGIGIGF